MNWDKLMPPGFGVRQSSGAFWPQHPKRQRTAAVQDAVAPTHSPLFLILRT